MHRIRFENAALLGSPGRHDILIEGERILSVQPTGAPSTEPANETIDATGATLMPGMVAGHSHFSYFEVSLDTTTALEMTYPATYIAVAATRSLGRTLAAGFTSAMGAGGIYDIDMTMEWLMRDGLVTGPRLLPCGRDLIPTGHPMDNRPVWWNAGPGPLGVTCDGPDEFRKAVREEAKRGAQVVKLYPEGGHGFPKKSARLTYEEIAAVVDTAERCGIRVRAHVWSRQGIWECLRAGVHIIDHADQMDEEIIDAFVRQGTYVLPSLYLLKGTTGILYTSEERDRHYRRAAEILPKGVAAGVKFVTGDDFGTQLMPHGTNGEELRCLVEDIGIPAAEVLKWATVNGAEMIGWPDLGEVAPGKIADLLLVDGNPAEDISSVADPTHIHMVMQGGKKVAARGRLTPA